MSRFDQARAFQQNPPPRMAANTPANALVVFDGWTGGGGMMTHEIFFRMNRELTKGETYSVAEIVHVDGRTKVVLNEIGGQWDITLFAAYR